MKKNALEFWVGLFVLLGAAAIGFLAFRAAGGQSFGKSSQTYTVYADFSDIGGLKPTPRSNPQAYWWVALPPFSSTLNPIRQKSPSIWTANISSAATFPHKF